MSKPSPNRTRLAAVATAAVVLATGPNLRSSMQSDALQSAAVRPPARVLRTYDVEGSPADVRQRLHVLREHGREKRRTDANRSEAAQPDSSNAGTFANGAHAEESVR